MQQKRSTTREQVPESTAVMPPSSPHGAVHRRRPHRWCGNCRDNAELVAAMLAAGVDAILDTPPTRDFQTDDGQTLAEALTLIGSVRAPESARDQLERAGIDLRYATHRPDERRWVRCLFSDAGVDRLLEQMARGAFPYAFEAHSSRAGQALRTQRAGSSRFKNIPAFWFLVADPSGSSARMARPASTAKVVVASRALSSNDRCAPAIAGGHQS